MSPRALSLAQPNDICDELQSTIRLFADDCVIYKEIRDEDDHHVLQRDLQRLSNWSTDWLMSFNVKKCGVMSITRKRNSHTYVYQLRDEVIPRVDQYKYLGVTITPDLRWNQHCQSIRQKANRTLGLIRRTLLSCSKK